MKTFFLILLSLTGITLALHAQDTTDLEDQLLQEEVIEEPIYDDETDYDHGEYESAEEDGYESADEEVTHSLVEPDQLPTTKKYQSDKINHKGFDEGKWRKVVGDQNYQETPPEEEEEESSAPPDFQWPSLPFGGEVLKAIAYTVIIAIVLFLLYFVFRNIKINPRSRFTPASYMRPDDEDIQQMDLAGLLKQALANNNFKLAIRYYFLTVLKSLNDAGKIRWEKDKTNREYLSELFSSDFHYDEMRKLTRGYEEVWYGDHMFGDESLRGLISAFESMHSKINPPKTL